MLGNKSKPSAASSSTKKELQGGSLTSNSINNNMGGAKGASLSSGGGGGMSPTNIAAASSSSSSSQQDWRKMSTADCSTNVPDQLRDIIKRYFLDPVVGTASSSPTAAATSATHVAAAGAGATTVGQAHHISTHAETGGGRNTAASAAVNHASTPAPSAGAAGTAPALAFAFAPKDGTYATPLSSMIALTQLATFSCGNSTDADGQSGGGVFDMFDGVDRLSLAAAASSTSVALPLPAFAFANYGFFPALDHHRGAFTALAGSSKSRNDPAQSPSSSGAHHRNRNTSNSNNRAASATFDSGATLVNSLLLSDVTQSPPPLFERGLRELISLVESSRPSSSASSVSATANVVVTGGGGGGGDSWESGAELFWGSPMMNASSSRGYLRDNFMYGAMFTSAMLTSSSGTDGGVPGGALGGGGISGSPTRQRPQQLANSSVTIVQDGSVIHRILHGALRELLAVSSTNSSSWQAAAARSLVPWWIRCIAAWEFCDANTRVTMCFNFLQACLPAEDPNHVSVVLESWSYVIKLDIASHAIYHDAAACWLQSSLEWLFLDAKASHRVSALCIISHLVRQGSAHLLQIHRAELFQALWNALTDMQSWIRELAAGTLQALLTTLLDRNYRTEQGGGVGGGGDSGMMDAGGMSSNGAGGLLRNIDMLESDSPPMSPLSADGGASLPMPNTRTTLQEEDADIRALVQRALTAFAPQQNHNLMTTFRASQHGRIMSWSGGLDDAGGNRGGGGGPMSDTGSMTDSFTAISPSAASATMMMGTSPAGSSNSGSTAAAQQQNVMHAGALVLGALLGADREIRLAHQQQNPHRPLADQAKSALDRTTDGGASTEITEHSEVEGSAEQGPDADPASGGPSAMFLPPANDHHHHHEGGGGSIGGPQLSMNSIGGSGNNIRDNNNSNTRAVTSAEMSPASLQLTAAIGTTTSGEFRTHSLAYGMAGGRNSTSGSSIVQSPVPGVPGTWSAPPGSPESLDPVLAVRHGGAVAAQPHHNGTGKSSATAFSHSPPQHSDAPVGGGGGGAVTGDPTPNNNNNNGQQGAEASWISPASAFLSDSDIRMLLMSIVVSRKKVYARIYACRLLPLLAAYHPTLFLVEYGEAALTEILGVAIHLKEAPQSSSSSLDKIHEDRGNILTSIGLLYRAISSTPHVALPPVYQQTLLDRIIPLLEEYLIAPAAAGTGTQQQSNNNNANGNVGSGGGPRQRVDAAATSLALLVGSLSSVHRGLCEDFVQTFSGIVLDAPHLTIETAGATAELYHFFPSLRRQAHAGLLRLITDSLRQSFVAAPPTQQHSDRPQLPTSRRHHVSHQRQPFSDDLLVPGAVNTRLTALYVLHNLSCNMSWPGAAMYFLDVCLPYLHHPDARVRRGCIECCGPMLAVDCTSSSFANAGENIASLNSPSASFAPWEANKSHRFSSTTYFPVSPPLGSQGILENSSWLCDHTNASAAAGASPHHPPHGSHHNGRSHIAILHRIVGRLMDVAVADPLPELRRAALHVFLTSWSYDGLIVGHTSALGDLFHILCDPSAQNRHMALSIASRVANRVPSFAAPRLRSTLANFLEDLSCLTGAKSSQGKSRLTSATPAGSRLLALQQPAMMRGGASGGDAPAVFSLTAALAGIEERLLLLFQLLHSIPIGAVMPMYLPILLQILQNVLSADSPVSSSATAVALSMVHFLLEEAPEHAWGAFMPFYILAVRHVDGNNQGKMLSALNLLQALVKCVAAVHSSNLSDAAELLEDSVVIGDGGGQEGRAGGAANPSSGQNSAALHNVRGGSGGSANRRLRGGSVGGHNDSTGPRRSSSLLLVRSAAAQQHHTEQQQQSSWMVTEAQLQATANLLHGWMRQRTIALSASASIAIMKLLGSLTAVEPLPSQPFVPVMEGGMDGVDSRRRADAAVGLEESRVVCDGSRGWPFEILQYLLSVLAGNVVPLSEEDQRITIAAILRIFHSTPSVARHFHAFIGPFFRLLERLLSQARYKAYASSGGAMFDMDAFDANSGNAATTAATASASAGASSSTIATYVSLLETVFSAIAQLLMSPDVSRSTYAHAATIVRMARAHWDAERPALLSRLCDVLSALNRQATEPLQEYVAWFVSSLLSALVHCCPQESKRELTVKVLMSIESFRGASTSNTLLLVVPTLCQILNTPNIPDDAKRHVGKALVRFIFSCDANPFIARVVECCTFQLQISERLFEAERQRIQKQIATVFNMRDAKKRAVLEYELSQTLSEASQVAFSAVRTSSLPRILINYANIGHAEVKQYPNPPAPPSTQAEAQQFAYDVISQKAEIPIWLLPWEAEIVAVICAAAGRCKSFDEYHASMVDRLGVRFGARSDVVRFFNSCANPCSHATLQRPIAVVATSPTTMMNAFYFSQQTTAFSHQQQATLFEDAMTPTTTTMTTPIPPQPSSGLAPLNNSTRQRLSFEQQQQQHAHHGSRDASNTTPLMASATR
ncbi:Hypothetical protein, putative [Bodo saltans]|uniref:Non-specific serine/threonine protein kinase n=1 Tax=Bodo saltans TaxID=75058 RepID=A0A0S4IRZ6_BODSA|nr:Hypothetical protein, putative [Bodo saltans]|eukprot:CUF53428.1 Hypothetical protein, putative [Bodo saltans]